MATEEISKAVEFLRQGMIIAYPTEAVYGMGCDPFNPEAVAHLSQLKGREQDKGYILLANHYEQVENLINLSDLNNLQAVLDSWPGPVTWILPATIAVPPWLVAANNTIAIRVTDHPVAREICAQFGGPIISTSANPSKLPPARTYQEVVRYFNEKIPFILKGQVGPLLNPTPIYDAVTGKIIRPGEEVDIK